MTAGQRNIYMELENAKLDDTLAALQELLEFANRGTPTEGLPDKLRRKVTADLGKIRERLAKWRVSQPI